jgi:hypothetical protein
MIARWGRARTVRMPSLAVTVLRFRDHPPADRLFYRRLSCAPREGGDGPATQMSA